MKNKLKNFIKRIGTEFIGNILNYLMITLIFGGLILGFTGTICGVGYVFMLLTQTTDIINLENVFNYGMGFSGLIIFIVTIIYFIVSLAIDFVKWIVRCWKES